MIRNWGCSVGPRSRIKKAVGAKNKVNIQKLSAASCEKPSPAAVTPFPGPSSLSACCGQRRLLAGPSIITAAPCCRGRRGGGSGFRLFAPQHVFHRSDLRTFVSESHRPPFFPRCVLFFARLLSPCLLIRISPPDWAGSSR